MEPLILDTKDLAYMAEEPYVTVQIDKDDEAFCFNSYKTLQEAIDCRRYPRHEKLTPMSWEEFREWKAKYLARDRKYGPNSGEQTNKNMLLALESAKQVTKKLQVVLDCDQSRDEPRLPARLRKLVRQAQELENEVAAVREALDPY